MVLMIVTGQGYSQQIFVLSSYSAELMACIITGRYLGEVNYAELLQLRFSCSDKQITSFSQGHINYGLTLICISLAIVDNIISSGTCDFNISIIP